MTCSDCAHVMVRRLQNRLDATEASDFEAHVAQCTACARDYQAHVWVRSMTQATAGDISHPGSLLLYDFVHQPASLEPSTRGLVRQHLQQCESCDQDVQDIGVLDAIELAQPGSQPASSRRRWWESGRESWQRLLRPRVWVPAAAAAVLVVIAGTALLQRPQPAPLVWASASPAAQQVAMRALTRSDTHEGVTRLDGAATTHLALQIDFLDWMAESYVLALRDPSGRVIWSGRASENPLRDGVLHVRINAARLAAGEYLLELHEIESGKSAVLSRARLQIR